MPSGGVHSIAYPDAYPCSLLLISHSLFLEIFSLFFLPREIDPNSLNWRVFLVARGANRDQNLRNFPVLSLFIREITRRRVRSRLPAPPLSLAFRRRPDFGRANAAFLRRLPDKAVSGDVPDDAKRPVQAKRLYSASFRDQTSEIGEASGAA